MSGKKRVALDNRPLYFKELDDDIRFVITFRIGYNTLSLNKIDEDKYDLIIDGYRFYDLMKTERLEKKYQIVKKERDEIKKKKLEEEYYKRALKYNGSDYYEGKEKEILLDDNNKNNNCNINNKYSYEAYKQHRKSQTNNFINNNYNPGNYNNNPNQNYNYNINNNNNDYYNQNEILTQKDINQIKQNINNNNNKKVINNNNNNNYNYDNNYNNNYEEEQRYPSFSTYQNTENNIGYNNNNYFYDNTRDNNNNNNNNLTNQLEDVFNKNKSNVKISELPTYTQILKYQNQNQLNQKNNYQNQNQYYPKQSIQANNNLINIGSIKGSKVNNSIKKSAIGNPPQSNNTNINLYPQNNNINNQNNYDFGFNEDDTETYDVDESNQITLNIYEPRGKKDHNKNKTYINKSSFKEPLKKEDYDMENPYNDN